MKWDVVFQDRCVGWCELQEDGLYWKLSCECREVSDQIRRLYWNGRCLGVLEQKEDRLVLRRRFSKASAPDLPPENRLPTLEREECWQGRVLECQMPPCIRTWKEYGSELTVPFSEEKPCPCPPLLCFFSVSDGFWRLRLDENEQPLFPDFD